jgi:hypothetical protein
MLAISPPEGSVARSPERRDHPLDHWVAQRSVACLWMTGLFFKPVHNVASPVADGSANPETARPRAEVAPVAQRRFRDPDESGHLLHRHQLVVGVGEFSVQGM